MSDSKGDQTDIPAAADSVRWLITGGSGLLGSNAARLLSVSGDVVCSARSTPPQSPFPFITAKLEDAASRDGLVSKASATAVFHSGAVASIEGCAADPALAHRINVEAAADLARQSLRNNAAFVYISTDAVFDGTAGNYSETSPTSPTSEYGRTKVRGEQTVLDANPNALIARVNFYGWSPTGRRSLAEFFFNRLSAGQETPGFTDTSVSTLQVSYLVAALRELVTAGTSGIVHVASSESTTKFDFGQRLAHEFGFNPDLVVPQKSTDHLQFQRGSNLGLLTDLVQKLLGRPMSTQRDGLQRLRAELDSGVPSFVTRFNTTIGQ